MASRRDSGQSNSTLKTLTVIPSEIVQVPDPRLRIVIDSREQKPWTFEPKQVAVVHRALSAGDYSLDGMEDKISLERKSLGDFVGTVIGDWLRFRKELIRLSAYDVAAIVVEANLSQIVNHEYESEALPLSVIGRVNGIFLDHGIPVFFWGERRLAQDMAHRFLLLAWRKLYVPNSPDDPAIPG